MHGWERVRIYTCLGSDHLVCLSTRLAVVKYFQNGCSLGIFSRFDVFLQPILCGTAEAKQTRRTGAARRWRHRDLLSVISFWVTPDLNGDDILP